MTAPGSHLGARAGKPRRAGLLLLVAAVVAAGGWWLYTRSAKDRATVGYATTPVKRGDISAVVTATGTLSPRIQVQVGSLVSGRIKELHADYNSEVKKGQVLAILDAQLFETDVAQAKARLASARAQLASAKATEANAKVQYERVRRLMSTGAVAAAEVDRTNADWQSAQAQVTAARAAITQSQAALEQARVNLEYTTVRSPIDGLVISRNVDVGQTVAASLQAPTLFVIAEDLRNMEVHTSVAESDVGQLQPGTAAQFTVDAFPGETFEGVVKQVRYEAVSVSNVVTYDAIISVDNRERKLRPGMTANVSFVLDERRGVLIVANRALRFQPSDPQLAPQPEPSERPRQASPPEWAGPGSARRRTLWLLRNGNPEPVAVELGLSDGSSSEIVSGEIAEGDLVIVSDGKSGDGRPPGNGQRRRGPPRVL